MDAHKIILTTLTKRQLSEIKKKYRKALREVYGMNRSPYYEESFEYYILCLAMLLFLGFTSTWLMAIVIGCVTFSQAGFIGVGAVLVILLFIILIVIFIMSRKIKLSFATVMSLLVIHWKTKINKIPTPDLE